MCGKQVISALIGSSHAKVTYDKYRHAMNITCIKQTEFASETTVSVTRREKLRNGNEFVADVQL